MRLFKKWMKRLAAASLGLFLTAITPSVAAAYPAGPDNPIPDRLVNGFQEVTKVKVVSSHSSSVGYWIAIGILAGLLVAITGFVVQRTRRQRLSPAV